jgi:hypothetical protein
MYVLQSGNQFESTLIDFSKHVFYPKQIKLQVHLLKKRQANIMMTSHVISNDPKLENICSVWSWNPRQSYKQNFLSCNDVSREVWEEGLKEGFLDSL